MKASGRIIMLMVIALVLNGCFTAAQTLIKKEAPPSQTYRERALAYEKEGDLRQAILCWEIEARLDNKSDQALKKIETLKRTAAKSAQAHFQRGKDHYHAKDLKNALREFLITIRLNPEHEQARFYLKRNLQNPEQTVYRVVAGDSFSKIAYNIYKDPGKANLIAYFNDMDPQKPLLIGTELFLPALGTQVLVTRVDIKDLLLKADEAYDKKQYTKLFRLVAAIQKKVPDNPKASQLADAGHFDHGLALMDQNRYTAAIEQFEQVSPQYEGRDQAISRARSLMTRQTLDQKLHTAREQLGRKAWSKVIKICEDVLTRDPGNDQAKMLFSNASYNLGKHLLDRGEAAQSMKVLSRIEPSYEDTGQLLALARARMKSHAETLYRDGVKHFINEDLEKAIKSWKMALELNPDHIKARQDMENAERLLDKLRTLDNGKK